jgi:hypothetical protein
VGEQVRVEADVIVPERARVEDHRKLDTAA